MFGVWTFSEAGGHAINEDTFVVRSHPHDELVWLCALADGQGGRAGGARASQLACQTLIEVAGEYSVQRLGEPGTWVTLCSQADKAVHADADAGLTTLIGFSVGPRGLTGASNGDSAVLAIDKRGATRVLTHAQHKNPPVGSGFAAVVPFGNGPAEPWTILAMSDGVWKYCGWDRIRDYGSRLRGPELIAALRRSAQLPNSGTFPDDFTVVVFQGCE